MPTLDHWETFINWEGVTVAAGIVLNDDKRPHFNGKQVYTSAVVRLDRENGTLQTRNTLYKLGVEKIPDAPPSQRQPLDVEQPFEFAG